MSPVKRICVFEHSVMTNFNCACPAIQRGQGSGFLSEGSSWLTACMSEQRRFWRDCADAQIQKRKMHVELGRLHLQLFLSHNSFAGCFTENKNIQHFHQHTAYNYSRESKSRWHATAIRIDYVVRLYRPPIVECRRPKCLATWRWGV